MRLSARLILAAAAALVLAAPASAASSKELAAREARVVRKVEQAKSTLRFFERHPHLLYAKDASTKHRAWRVVAVARQHFILGRAELERIRALLRRRSRAAGVASSAVPDRLLGDVNAWLCIFDGKRHGRYSGNGTGEGGNWRDPDSPYYGGLQMDMDFQRAYGAEFLARWGTADHWPPRV
jgi:hypothetical protein